MTDLPPGATLLPERERRDGLPPGAVLLPASEVGYAEDIAKGAAGGLGRGVTGLVGIQGTVGGLFRAGLGAAGVPEEYLTKGAAIARHLPGIRALTGPSGADLQKSVEQYTGEFYQPKTIPGQYASTIAEFAPGMIVPGGSLAARGVNTLTGAIGSETAGQLTKGTAAEPYARLVGGVGGGLAGAKLVTPTIAPPETYQAAVRALEAEGIPLSAGERTGSKALRLFESNAADMPLVSGPAKHMQAQTAGAFDRAVTERMYDPAQLRARGVPEGVSLPDPRVVNAGRQSLSDEYTRITQSPFVSDPALHRRMAGAVDEYERLVMPHNRVPAIEQTRNNIVDRLIAGQGRMAGDEYQSIRSQLGDDIRASTNSSQTRALREMRAAVDDAYARGLPPGEAAALQLTNRRYANMKQMKDAVAAGDEHLLPLKVAQSARARRPEEYAAQSGDLDALARAAKTVLRPLPNSQTAARTGMQKLFNVPSALAAGGIAGASAFNPVVGAAAASPFIAARLALSRPGQAYLGNQALPQNARDILAQTIMQQAVSQRERDKKRNRR